MHPFKVIPSGLVAIDTLTEEYRGEVKLLRPHTALTAQ